MATSSMPLANDPPVNLSKAQSCGSNRVYSLSFANRVWQVSVENAASLAKRIVESQTFNYAIATFVFINTITLGLEGDLPNWKGWYFFEWVFTTVFLLEMILKLVVLGREYFYDVFNRLDCFLVASSVLDTYILSSLDADLDLQTLSILRFLRLFRLARVFRFFKRFRTLILICYSIFGALRSTFYIFTVMFLAIYVGSIFMLGTLIPDMYPAHSEDMQKIVDLEIISQFNPHIYFGGLSKSMLTLFNIAIMSEWAEIVRPLALFQPGLALFLVAFVICVSFGILNVVIGMIMETVLANAQRLEREVKDELLLDKIQTLSNIHSILSDSDVDGDGVVTAQEIELALNATDSPLKQVLDHLGMRLPLGFSSVELLCMLDDDCVHKLPLKQFVEKFHRLLDSGPFQNFCLLQTTLNSLKREVQSSRRKIGQRLDDIERTLLSRLDNHPLERVQLPLSTQLPSFCATSGVGRNTPDTLGAKLDFNNEADLIADLRAAVCRFEVRMRDLGIRSGKVSCARLGDAPALAIEIPASSKAPSVPGRERGSTGSIANPIAGSADIHASHFSATRISF